MKAKYAGEAARNKSEKGEIKKKAEAIEKQSLEGDEKSKHALHPHDSVEK